MKPRKLAWNQCTKIKFRELNWWESYLYYLRYHVQTGIFFNRIGSFKWE